MFIRSSNCLKKKKNIFSGRGFASPAETGVVGNVENLFPGRKPFAGTHRLRPVGESSNPVCRPPCARRPSRSTRAVTTARRLARRPAASGSCRAQNEPCTLPDGSGSMDAESASRNVCKDKSVNGRTGPADRTRRRP